MEKINYDEKCTEMANKFWGDIFKRTFHDSDKFTVDNLKCNIGDKNDLIATFDICRNISWRLCGCSSYFKCKFKELPFNNEAFEWLVLGWGDPQITSKYGYCYFDFREGLVYIDGNDVEERVITIQKAFEEIYK